MLIIHIKIKNQRENTDNVLTFKFDNRSLHYSKIGTAGRTFWYIMHLCVSKTGRTHAGTTSS